MLHWSAQDPSFCMAAASSAVLVMREACLRQSLAFVRPCFTGVRRIHVLVWPLQAVRSWLCGRPGHCRLFISASCSLVIVIMFSIRWALMCRSKMPTSFDIQHLKACSPSDRIVFSASVLDLQDALSSMAAPVWSKIGRPGNCV